MHLTRKEYTKLYVGAHDEYNGYKKDECIACESMWDQPPVQPIKKWLSYKKMLFNRDDKYYVTSVAVGVERWSDYWLTPKSSNGNFNYFMDPPDRYFVCVKGGSKKEKKFDRMVEDFYWERNHHCISRDEWYFYLDVQLLTKEQYDTWMQEHPETKILKY